MRPYGMRLLLVCLVAVLLAPVHAKTTGSEKEVGRLRQLAKTYEQRGRAGDAKRYLQEALSLAPTNAAVLGDLLRLTVRQRDEFSMWAHLLARRATDEKGVFKQSKALTADIARAIQPVLKIAQIRAGAVDRLAAQAKRLRRPSDAPAAHYLRALARACTREVLALRTKHGTLFDDIVRWCATHGLEKRRKIRIIKPANMAWCVGFNPLSFAPDALISVNVDAVSKAFMLGA